MKYLILLAVLAGCAVKPKPLPEASSGKVSECMRYASVLKQSDPSLDEHAWIKQCLISSDDEASEGPGPNRLLR